MVRVQDSDAIGIDIVHDLHLSLVINSYLQISIPSFFSPLLSSLIHVEPLQKEKQLGECG